MNTRIRRPRLFPRALLIAAAPFATMVVAQSAAAETFYWTPNSGTAASWGTAANWSNLAAGGGATGIPGASDTATFNTTANDAAAVVTLDADRAASGLTFNTAGGTTITAGTTGGPYSLTLGAGGMTMGSASLGVVVGSPTAAENVPIILAANQSWLNNSSVASNPIMLVRGPISAGQPGATTLTLGGTISSSSLNNITGVVSDGGGDRTLAITLNGSAGNRWTLSGNNTYTGATTITSGAMTIGNANALGSTTAGTTIASGAGLFFRSTVGTVAQEPLTMNGNGPSNAGALRNVSGDNNWTGAISANTTAGAGTTIASDAGLLTLHSPADVTTTGVNNLTFLTAGTTNPGRIQVNSTISGPATVAKTGIGTLTYHFETKTYTGATNVNNGTLQVDIGVTATSSVTVASGASLRGSGGAVINTGANVTVNGTVAAGSAAATIGSFGTGPLSITATGALSADINSTTVAGDLINVTGNFALDAGNASTLTLTDLAASPSPLPEGTVIPLVNYSGTWNGGLFTMAGVGTITDNGTVFTVGNTPYQLDYDLGGANGAVALVAVPEPGSLAAIAGVGLLMLRRRRQAS